MADKTFRPKRGTQSTMESLGTVLKAGEMFFEYPSTGVGTGECRVKMGDGTTAYSSLPYAIDLNNVVRVSTAGTAVGSASKPVYVNSSGVATACSSTVGSSTKPVYMSSGTITACSSTVGSATRHMYMSSGTMTASSTTVGSSTKPIYMSSGTFTACSDTVGSSTSPVYMSSGTITECDSLAFGDNMTLLYTFSETTGISQNVDLESFCPFLAIQFYAGSSIKRIMTKIMSFTSGSGQDTVFYNDGGGVIYSKSIYYSNSTTLYFGSSYALSITSSSVTISSSYLCPYRIYALN